MMLRQRLEVYRYSFGKQ